MLVKMPTWILQTKDLAALVFLIYQFEAVNM